MIDPDTDNTEATLARLLESPSPQLERLMSDIEQMPECEEPERWDGQS